MEEGAVLAYASKCWRRSLWLMALALVVALWNFVVGAIAVELAR